MDSEWPKYTWQGRSMHGQQKWLDLPMDPGQSLKNYLCRTYHRTDLIVHMEAPSGPSYERWHYVCDALNMEFRCLVLEPHHVLREAALSAHTLPEGETHE